MKKLRQRLVRVLPQARKARVRWGGLFWKGQLEEMVRLRQAWIIGRK